MTAVLSRPGPAAVPPPSDEPSSASTRRRWSQLPEGWPLFGAIALWPLWWALGLVPFVAPVAGTLLLVIMLRRGRIVVPPGFWIWLLFLAIVVASAVMLNVKAADTLAPSGYGRYVAYTFRLVDYAAVSVFMLYVVNTPERLLPRLRIVRWMVALAVTTIALGMLSIAFPSGGFVTPFSTVLPSSLDALLGGSGGRVSLAQLQPVLGVYAPRPAAPFSFTNAWGCTLALLLVWTVLAGWAGGRRTRVLTALLVVVSIVPIVYSLNRGMWIGLGLAVLYLALRLAARGRLVVLGAIALVLGIGTIAFVASPLQTIVSERLDNGHSNEIRANLAGQAIKAAEESPLLGFGTTRAVLGSGASIAVGQTATCPKCGNADIGSTGQYFLLMVAQGFLGLVVYVAYFLRTLWAFRRDASPLGIAGTLVVLMSLFFGIAYTGLVMPLAIVFLSIGLLWRNAAVRAGTADVDEPTWGPQVPA